MTPMTVCGIAAERDGLADDVGVAVETPDPDPVAEHDDLVAVRAIFLGAEGAAAQDRRAEQPEEIGGHPPRPKLFGKRSAGEVHDTGVERRDVAKHLRLLAVVHELGGRAAAVDALRRSRLQHHQPVGVGKRHRLEEDGVDDREDRGVGADAERQRRHRRGGEAPALPEHPQRLPQVLEEAFNHGGPNYVSGLPVDPNGLDGGDMDEDVCRGL